MIYFLAYAFLFGIHFGVMKLILDPNDKGVELQITWKRLIFDAIIAPVVGLFFLLLLVLIGWYVIATVVWFRLGGRTRHDGKGTWF